MMRIAWVSIILCFLCAYNSQARNNTPALGGKITSPDKVFTVHLVGKNQFRIVNNGTREVAPYLQSPTYVYSLRWMGNSKAFLTVEHLPEGSFVAVTSYNKGKWTRKELWKPFRNPQRESMALVLKDMYEDHADITYKGWKRSSDGEFNYFALSCTVNSRGSISKAKRKPISANVYKEVTPIN